VRLPFVSTGSDLVVIRGGRTLSIAVVMSTTGEIYKSIIPGGIT